MSANHQLREKIKEIRKLILTVLSSRRECQTIAENVGKVDPMYTVLQTLYQEVGVLERLLSLRLQEQMLPF